MKHDSRCLLSRLYRLWTKFEHNIHTCTICKYFFSSPKVRKVIIIPIVVIHRVVIVIVVILIVIPPIVLIPVPVILLARIPIIIFLIVVISYIATMIPTIAILSSINSSELDLLYVKSVFLYKYHKANEFFKLKVLSLGIIHINRDGSDNF